MINKRIKWRNLGILDCFVPLVSCTFACQEATFCTSSLLVRELSRSGGDHWGNVIKCHSYQRNSPSSLVEGVGLEWVDTTLVPRVAVQSFGTATFYCSFQHIRKLYKKIRSPYLQIPNLSLDVKLSLLFSKIIESPFSDQIKSWGTNNPC